MGEIEREYPSLRAHLIGMLGIFAALFLGLTLLLYLTSRSLFAEALQKELSGDLDWMASTLLDHPSLLGNPVSADSLCKAISRYKGYRVTLIDSTGKVLADSHVPLSDVSGIENHLGRPEVAEAGTKGIGFAWRHSNTVGMRMLYVARRMPDQPVYLRMAAGPVILNSFHRASAIVFAMFLAMFTAAAGAIIWWISRKISSPLLQMTGSGEVDAQAPPRWDAKFREAEILNLAFQGYVGQIRNLGRQVEKQRDKLVAVLNQLQEGILILSADGKVVAANPSSLRLLGVESDSRDPAAWLGRPFRAMLPESPLADWVDEAASSERTPIIHVDKGPGTPFDLLCHLAPLDATAVLEAGEEKELLLTLFDVTEFRHLDRVKSEFVANASHELKTPLSSIKGYAEALMEGAMENPKVREPFIGKIHANALRLERLVQDLLSLSHLEANPSPKETEPLPLRGYVNAAANLHRHAMEGTGIRLENHVAEEVSLLMEPRDLELILNNLVGNAVKYNRAAGKVKVWTEASDGLRLYVKDTGIGIPEEMLPRIFERFYRAGASRASKEGTGLGLAIVKHAAHKYGMTVSAESTLGEGSRFVIGIPAALVSGLPG